jgi:hypothetical protein
VLLSKQHLIKVSKEKEIAEHLSRYFGVLITEAKFGDLKDFSVLAYKPENNE